jgi:hypothetical protein
LILLGVWLPAHTASSKFKLGGRFIGAFGWAAEHISAQNQLLEADPELQVQNIE